MKKQFRRAGALMLALLMLMMAAPALAEDAPSAADGTQIEAVSYTHLTLPTIA